MSFTVPSSTLVLRWWRRMSRIGGAISLGENARRHLVQQRLEQVMVVAVNDSHVDVSASQSSGGEQATEATAHDHDAMPVAVSGSFHNNIPRRLDGDHVFASLSRHRSPLLPSWFLTPRLPRFPRRGVRTLLEQKP